MSQSNLSFSSPEIRVATLALAVVATTVPFYQLFRNRFQQDQDSAPHMRTFRKLLKAYSSLRPQALVANATPSFEHSVLPSNLGIPTRKLSSFKDHAGNVFALFENFRMIPVSRNGHEDLHFCRDTNTVIAHCKMGGDVDKKSDNGAKLVAQGFTEWWLECVLFVEMDVGGKRVVGIREFVDAAKSAELKKRLTDVLEA